MRVNLGARLKSHEIKSPVMAAAFAADVNPVCHGRDNWPEQTASLFGKIGIDSDKGLFTIFWFIMAAKRQKNPPKGGLTWRYATIKEEAMMLLSIKHNMGHIGK